MGYKHLILAVISASLAALLISGCAPSTRYKVLSFFFDGVTDPDSVEKKKPALDWKKKGKDKKQERKVYGQHGPFAAKMCEGCHVRGSNALVVPIEQLCLNCHTLQIEKKWIHGPLIAGGCRICHEPHGSGNPYLLVSESERFCFHCHNERDVLKNPVHSDLNAVCTSCHDAHASDNEYLLR
jgi:predicted CXXCH cytochrome family protein